MVTTSEYMEALDTVRKAWGDDFVMKVCLTAKNPMSFDYFLNACTACGGNLGGMLLTGVSRLYPAVWEAIPAHMGAHAFFTICNLLILLGIDVSEG